MSILLGPYDDTEPSTESKAEQLLVFGYACKLFRDDTKALLESSGQLLIPWMGDNSLMVDRYDVRNRLEDKSQFGVKSNLPYKMSAKERELEEQLDMERYLALHWDDIRVEEQEEEERRRASENTMYSAIGFSYDDETQESPQAPSSPPPVERAGPRPKAEEGEEFVAPTGLIIPEGMKVPATTKLHSIIQKTALFVCQQGTQFEIIIKTKQQANPSFSFLEMQDPLFPYYCHLKAVLANGTYVPVVKAQTETENVNKDDTEAENEGVQGESEKQALNTDTNGENEKEDTGNVESEPTNSSSPAVEVDAGSTNGSTEQDHSTDEESGSGSDSDDEGYLHPLLMQAMNPRSKSSTPTPTVPTAKETPPQEEEPSLSAVSFRAKTMVVNAAPELKETVQETTVQANAAQETTTENAYGSYPYSGPPSHYIEHPYYQDAGGYPPPPQMHEGHYHHHPHMAHYSHPPHNLNPSDQYSYNYDSYYETMGYPPSAVPSSNTVPIPPPDLQSIIDKTASYVAKNGDTFEATVLKRHVDDPKFGFLNPWDKHHSYYQQQKQVFSMQNSASGEPAVQAKTNFIATERHSVQKLSSSGSVSFKLQSKTTKLIGEPVVERSVRESELEPQAKKPRVEGSGAKIGSTVQEFLSTVKELFKHGQTPS